MANVSRINGFRPVKHVNGSPFNGQGNIYVVASGQTLAVGDVAYTTGTGQTGTGVPEVTGTASALMAGPVIAIINAKLDPVTGKMTSGSISLDIPQVAAAGAYVVIADSPDIVCEVEKASFALTDIGQNLDVTGTAGGGSTGTSQQFLGTATTNASWRVLGMVQRVDVDTVGAYSKLLVTPNAHYLKVSVTAN
jgi:hypothetical protein